jgi:hypothetical protein
VDVSLRNIIDSLKVGTSREIKCYCDLTRVGAVLDNPHSIANGTATCLRVAGRKGSRVRNKSTPSFGGLTSILFPFAGIVV